VHPQRKRDALNPYVKLRKKSSKNEAECKGCTEDIVSPYYKLRRKSEKFPGGEEVHRGTMNFEGFQDEQSCRRVCAECLQGVQKEFEDNLSLERKKLC
jgi:hypothetical protein